MKKVLADRLSQLSRRNCLVLAAGGLAAAFGPAQVEAALARGDVVDWPQLELLDGRRLEAAHWKGHAAVIVFWSLDCPYCRRHNERLDKLYRATQASGSGLRILAIATDSDAQAVRSFVRDKDYHFPVAIDGGAIRARLTERKLVPMTVLIDRQGRLLMVIPGEMSEDDLLGLARQLA